MFKLNKKLILGSNSPRRKEILKLAGFEFDVVVKEVAENFPEYIAPEEVPVYLAELKSNAFQNMAADICVITADTVVILNGSILGKPKDENEAANMLQKMSGKEHKVVSGVSIKLDKNRISFSDITTVKFRQLSNNEIDYYISNYKPMDKAGAYGIQEWIGLVGIEKIEGSFYNVMGLPIHKVYNELILL